MKLFGFDVKRLRDMPKGLRTIYSQWRRVWDYLTGAWQADGVRTLPDNPLLNSAVFACMRLISSDVAKMPMCIKRKTGDVWKEVSDSPYSKLLQKPNFWQTRIEFFVHWVLSLLHYGNAYVLLNKDNRNMVNRMTVLDPRKVQVMVADQTGDIFYKVSLGSNPLAGLYNTEDVYIPAEFILHHKYMPIEHPLIGCPPLRVATLAANTGRKIIAAHAELFTNGIVPPGILTLPEGATEAQVEALATQWAEFRRTGRTAVLESTTKFEAISQKSIDAQALELTKLTYMDICVAFGVPGWKIGVEPIPAGTTAETSNLIYLCQTLQIVVEEIEALLDDKLALPSDLSAEFDTDALYRMDTMTRYKAATEGVKGGWMKPNEGRAKAANLEPVEGGDTCYMQQQNFSLAALNARDTAPQSISTAPQQGSSASEDDPNADNDADSFPTQDKALQAALGSSYKGTWKAGATHVAGEHVKRSGRLWRALQDTAAPPSVHESTWHACGGLK